MIYPEEIWATHPRFLKYEISDAGRVRRSAGGSGSRKGKILTSRIGRTGYVQVQIEQRQRKVHALVLEAFISLRPHGMHALHSDDNKANNRVANLRWGTASENYADRVANGGGNAGARNGNSVVDELRSKLIAGLSAEKVPQRRIASVVGVSQATVSRFASGRGYV